MYAIYLRKSRADVEREKEQAFDTLARHKSVLIKYAAENSLTVTKIYEELESGESIIQRPQMLELLKDVELKKYAGVIVMDIDRLGRGDMRDQGLILDTFKGSATKIITPRKTYDLDDEFDEEYTEFESFMARKELKLINRRLQRGRIKSFEEGNYLGTRPPYGYDVVTEKRQRKLVPNAQEAEVVRKIFALYANEDYGSKKVAKLLNQLGIKSATGIEWTGSAVLAILKNRVYTGRLEWKKKIYSKSKTPDRRRETKTNSPENVLFVENAHEPIISAELFEKATQKLKGRYHVPYATKLTNPLAGLIVCAKCAKPMVYRPYGNKAPHIVCVNCSENKSSKFEYVERAMFDSLRKKLEQFKSFDENISPINDVANRTNDFEAIIKQLSRELETISSQKDRLHDLLEQGIYDTTTFLERSSKLSERAASIDKSILEFENRLSATENSSREREIIPILENVIAYYDLCETAKEKNTLLKTVICKISYRKEKDWQHDNFELEIALNIGVLGGV